MHGMLTGREKVLRSETRKKMKKKKGGKAKKNIAFHRIRTTGHFVTMLKNQKLQKVYHNLG